MAKEKENTLTFEEEKALLLDEVKKEAEKILSEAESKAQEILKNAQESSVNTGDTENKASDLLEEEKAEIAKGEEYVEVTLFKDNDKYQDDVYVAVGDQNCLIKRGIPVKIKRKFYNVLTQSNEQDLRTAQLIEKESQK